MINKQLINYIKNETERGVTTGDTKNILLATGWKERDIQDAYKNLSTVKSTSSKKFIYIFVILLLVGGSIFVFMKYDSVIKILETIQGKETITKEEVPLLPAIEETIPAPIEVIKEVDKVGIIMNEICEGYLTNNNSLITKNVSAENIDFFTNIKLDPIDSCTINKIYEKDTVIIANVDIILKSPEKTAAPNTFKNMVFIKTDSLWKYDLTASENFATNQQKDDLLSGDPDGHVDLIVTNVAISSKHAVVNDKNLKIIFTIKNIGTKTSEKGSPLIVSMEGFKDSIPVSGGDYGPLMPEETVEWTWYPYKYNATLEINDTAGPKTIKLELNPDHEITESNYDNNIFEKTIQIYAK